MDRQGWAQLAHGAWFYLVKVLDRLRTNCTEEDHLTQTGECFRTSKSDLHPRPVYHQTEARVEAHILVCYLTPAPWRTMEMWMKSKGPGDCARRLIKGVSTVRRKDVVPAARSNDEAGAVDPRLRVVARPEKKGGRIAAHLGLELPQSPKVVQNGQPRNTP